MKDIFSTVGKVMGLLFAALVIGYTSWLTYLLAQMLIPDQVFLQVMTLVLFDVAALVWFVQFLTTARGTMQWALAAIGFLVAIVGTVIMAVGELVLGQQLVVIEDPTRIGWILIATLAVSALVHVLLIYLFHFSDPMLMNRIETAQKVGAAISQAGQDARAEIDRNMPEITANLVDSGTITSCTMYAGILDSRKLVSALTITTLTLDGNVTFYWDKAKLTIGTLVIQPGAVVNIVAS